MSRLSNNLVLPPNHALTDALRQLLAHSAANSTSTDKGSSTPPAPPVPERPSVLKAATDRVDLTFHQVGRRLQNAGAFGDGGRGRTHQRSEGGDRPGGTSGPPGRSPPSERWCVRRRRAHQ